MYIYIHIILYMTIMTSVFFLLSIAFDVFSVCFASNFLRIVTPGRAPMSFDDWSGDPPTELWKEIPAMMAMMYRYLPLFTVDFNH